MIITTYLFPQSFLNVWVTHTFKTNKTKQQNLPKSVSLPRSTFLTWILRTLWTVKAINKSMKTMNHCSKRICLEAQRNVVLPRKIMSLSKQRFWATDGKFKDLGDAIMLMSRDAKCPLHLRSLICPPISWLKEWQLWQYSSTAPLSSVAKENERYTYNWH